MGYHKQYFFYLSHTGMLRIAINISEDENFSPTNSVVAPMGFWGTNDAGFRYYGL